MPTLGRQKDKKEVPKSLEEQVAEQAKIIKDQAKQIEEQASNIQDLQSVMNDILINGI